jgi:hypothetical protein
MKNNLCKVYYRNRVGRIIGKKKDGTIMRCADLHNKCPYVGEIEKSK